jgi:hypothetical protein
MQIRLNIKYQKTMTTISTVDATKFKHVSYLWDDAKA